MVNQQNNGEWVPTTCYLHWAKALQLAEAGETLRFGRLPFTRVARETGLDERTVAHWFSLKQKRRLNSEYMVLVKYYGFAFKDAWALVYPDGTSLPVSEVSEDDQA